MTLTRSFIRNAATTPTDARIMNMAQLVANADGTPRVGVLGGANPSIVSTTGTMSVAIAAAEFATSKGRADGVSIFANDGTVNVAIGAAPASNSRIDVIWVKHNDSTTGDANSLPTFGVTPGAAAASPTKPAIPTGALELATLRVYAGTTATNGGANTLVNTYQMTAGRGGEVAFRTKTELDAWTTAVDGQTAYVIGDSQPYRWLGGKWVIPNPRISMQRSGTAATIGSSAYVNLAQDVLWTEYSRNGFAAFSGGIIAPESGLYLVSYRVRTSAIPILAGVTVNNASPTTIDQLRLAAASGSAISSNLIAESSGFVWMDAGQTLRLFGLAASGTPSWPAVATGSAFEAKLIR